MGFSFKKEKLHYKRKLRLLTDYGDCGLTVMTSGCGPGNEGSTPSFRPFRKWIKNLNC